MRKRGRFHSRNAKVKSSREVALHAEVGLPRPQHSSSTFISYRFGVMYFYSPGIPISDVTLPDAVLFKALPPSDLFPERVFLASPQLFPLKSVDDPSDPSS